MRFASFLRRDGSAGYGRLDEAGLLDLSVLPGAPADLKAVIEGTGLPALRALAGDRPADLALAEVTLVPPITAPEKIICVGVNYANRNEEYRDSSEAPKYPSLFVRFPGSFVGHGQDLVRPTASEQLDYEGEIVLVIGLEGRHVPRERALDHVAGVTLANEGSVRDWIRHGKFNVTQGKNFDRSGSIGPAIVPADEVDLTKPMRIMTRVNGEIRQDDTTANMMFDMGALIAYISTFTTLKRGDLILTGTPTGAGARFDPPVWLKPGDVIEVEVDGVGLLRNGVRSES